MSRQRFSCGRAPPPGGCQHCRIDRGGALQGGGGLQKFECKAQACAPRTHAHRQKRPYGSVLSTRHSANFPLQGRKADERGSHLLHTAQSDGASQIHNSPHTAF